MRTWTNRLIVALSFTFAIGFAAPASAYVVIGPECGGIHWNQPVAWYFNHNNYSNMTESAAEAIMVASFDAWTEPCCSAFEHNYAGTTTNDTSSQGNILKFYEDAWPSTLGDVQSTIGVTFNFQVYGDCVLGGADISFNGVGFDFINGQPQTWSQADLQSIATHEIGHFLGLDHPPVQGATMYASYDGGTAARSLHQDDIDGVCYLYYQSCSCTSSSDCQSGQDCVGGTCVVPDCTSDADCTYPLVCLSNGDCGSQTCTSDSQCPTGYSCTGGTCYPAGDCKVCQACSENTDCGASGFCAQFDGGVSVCSQMCPNGTCPGDAECYTVSDGTDDFNICLNPNADADGLCPAGYVCDAGSTPTAGCANLGASCTDDNYLCGPTNDICLDDGSTVWCSCTCSSDVDCGAGNSCMDLGDGSKACVPGSADPCAGVTCPTGEACDPRTGQCAASDGCPGLGNVCDDQGTLCTVANDVCLTNDPNASPVEYFCSCMCNSDADCSGGICVPLSNGESACIESPCAGVSCPAGQACDPATGNCVSTGTDTNLPGTDTTPVGTDTSVVGTDTTVVGTDTGVAGTDTAGVDVVGADNGLGSGGSTSDDCSCTVRRSSAPTWPLFGLLGAIGALVFLRRRRD